MGVSTILVSITMLNILIAILSDTYNVATEGANKVAVN